MKTECIAECCLCEDDKYGDETQIRHGKGKFFIKYRNRKLRQISLRDAIKMFLVFLNTGEATSHDLKPLLDALPLLGNDAPFAKGSTIPWQN
jgi:hypothetical protein